MPPPKVYKCVCGRAGPKDETRAPCATCKQFFEDRNLIVRIETHGDNLSEGESGLMETVVRQLEEGRPMSERQRTWAEDIDDKRVR